MSLTIFNFAYFEIILLLTIAKVQTPTNAPHTTTMNSFFALITNNIILKTTKTTSHHHCRTQLTQQNPINSCFYVSLSTPLTHDKGLHLLIGNTVSLGSDSDLHQSHLLTSPTNPCILGMTIETNLINSLQTHIIERG